MIKRRCKLQENITPDTKHWRQSGSNSCWAILKSSHPNLSNEPRASWPSQDPSWDQMPRRQKKRAGPPGWTVESQTTGREDRNAHRVFSQLQKESPSRSAEGSVGCKTASDESIRQDLSARRGFLFGSDFFLRTLCKTNSCSVSNGSLISV